MLGKHSQNRDERVYADFSNLLWNRECIRYDFDIETFHFEYACGGFCFGDWGRMFYVCCYNENGDYNNTLDIILINQCGTILRTLRDVDINNELGLRW